MDIFGPSWVNHHEKVRKNWEEKVGEEDLVIIPGDVSWGLRADEAMADLRWIHRLPGRKVITKGNHDLWWTSVTRLNRLYDDMTFLQNHCYMTAEGVAVCGTRGWICPGTDPTPCSADRNALCRHIAVILKKGHVVVKTVEPGHRGPPQIVISLGDHFSSGQPVDPAQICHRLIRSESPGDVAGNDDQILLSHLFLPVFSDLFMMVYPTGAENIHGFLNSLIKG